MAEGASQASQTGVSMQRVFYMKLDELSCEDWQNTQLHKISTQRRDKVLRCVNMMDQVRSLAAGLLLYHGENSLTQEERAYCSITHAGNYAAVVFSDAPVGIDVEFTHRFQSHPDKLWRMAHKIFSQEEWDVFLTHPNGTGFLARTWTRKEAYGKRHGVGLAMDLPSLNTLDEDAFYSEYFKDGCWLSLYPKDCDFAIEEVMLSDLA